MAFKHKSVRDLTWAFGSVNIIEGSDLIDGPVRVFENKSARDVLESSAIWLYSLDDDPAHLLSWLEETRGMQKIGIYFSALVEYWLRFSPYYRSISSCRVGLVSAVQLTDKDLSVVGQLKFVFSRPSLGDMTTVTYCHLECTYKAFLDCGDSDSTSSTDCAIQPPWRGPRLVGPFLGETLADRVARIKHKGSLAFKKSVQQWIRSIFVDSSLEPPRIESLIMVRGHIFVPISKYLDSRSHFTTPLSGVSGFGAEIESVVNVEFGTWWIGGGSLGAEEVVRIFEALYPASDGGTATVRFALLDRSFWLGPNVGMPDTSVNEGWSVQGDVSLGVPSLPLLVGSSILPAVTRLLSGVELEGETGFSSIPVGPKVSAVYGRVGGEGGVAWKLGASFGGGQPKPIKRTSNRIISRCNRKVEENVDGANERSGDEPVVFAIGVFRPLSQFEGNVVWVEESRGFIVGSDWLARASEIKAQSRADEMSRLSKPTRVETCEMNMTVGSSESDDLVPLSNEIMTGSLLARGHRPQRNIRSADAPDNEHVLSKLGTTLVGIMFKFNEFSRGSHEKLVESLLHDASFALCAEAWSGMETFSSKWNALGSQKGGARRLKAHGKAMESQLSLDVKKAIRSVCQLTAYNEIVAVAESSNLPWLYEVVLRLLHSDRLDFALQFLSSQRAPTSGAYTSFRSSAKGFNQQLENGNSESELANVAALRSRIARSKALIRVAAMEELSLGSLTAASISSLLIHPGGMSAVVHAADTEMAMIIIASAVATHGSHFSITDSDKASLSLCWRSGITMAITSMNSTKSRGKSKTMSARDVEERNLQNSIPKCSTGKIMKPLLGEWLRLLSWASDVGPLLDRVSSESTVEQTTSRGLSVWLKSCVADVIEAAADCINLEIGDSFSFQTSHSELELEVRRSSNRLAVARGIIKYGAFTPVLSGTVIGSSQLLNQDVVRYIEEMYGLSLGTLSHATSGSKYRPLKHPQSHQALSTAVGVQTQALEMYSISAYQYSFVRSSEEFRSIRILLEKMVKHYKDSPSFDPVVVGFDSEFHDKGHERADEPAVIQLALQLPQNFRSGRGEFDGNCGEVIAWVLDTAVDAETEAGIELFRLISLVFDARPSSSDCKASHFSHPDTGRCRDILPIGFSFSHDASKLVALLRRLMPVLPAAAEAAPALVDDPVVDVTSTFRPLAPPTFPAVNFFSVYDVQLEVMILAQLKPLPLAASAFAGVEGVGSSMIARGATPSLRAVCAAYLGKQLDKSEQCSDWDQRPLTKAQVSRVNVSAFGC